MRYVPFGKKGEIQKIYNEFRKCGSTVGEMYKKLLTTKKYYNNNNGYNQKRRKWFFVFVYFDRILLCNFDA